MINERDVIILLYIFLLWINVTLVTDIIVRIFLSYQHLLQRFFEKENTAVYDNGL